MAYSGLSDFINDLENRNELKRIKVFTDPVLEIAEITDRITKSGGKALLFENTGTDFPVLINGYGSDLRVALAIGRENLDDVGVEIENMFNNLSGNRDSLIEKISALPFLFKLSGLLPSLLKHRGKCQDVIYRNPDLGILPVLKCWPYDGGRFITLPMVHTIHPETGKTNVGMYRMQVLDGNTTAMHWQRHKTGANHFEAWKKYGGKMPVSVALGGDPVYAYSATAPLPENINEYILAGFLRKKKVKMVKCLTNDLYVPSDADIVLEGFVDPGEELIWEGPFGDHTGFYSLADWYPKFHITCITHSKNAVYPATIVGIPPHEDVWLAKATERIFLAPIKIAFQPEIEDFHLPVEGIAHNLLIVKIKKSFPGQGMKVISSLFGTGQMMFTKYLVVVSGDINIRDYYELMIHLFSNVDIARDLVFSHGPLDILDHSAEAFSFGGKLGVDATIKLSEETKEKDDQRINNSQLELLKLNLLSDKNLIKDYNINLFEKGIPIIIISVNRYEDPEVIEKIISNLKRIDHGDFRYIALVVDHTVDPGDYSTVAWQILGNSDPERDHEYISPASIIIDGTIKAYRKGGFSRKWPNVVSSDLKTISKIDEQWNSYGLGPFVPSPSLKFKNLCRHGTDEIIINNG
jgi:4-hydroxy-3-polyprenylbenzoate decarboxylase